jgi:hypothetical protein
VRRAKQPALFSIVLYARSSRTTESSFTPLTIQEKGFSCHPCLFSVAKTARYPLASYSLLSVKGRFAMAKTAADVLVEGLIDWGVDVIFGLPGDGINGIMESLRTHQEQNSFCAGSP